MQFSPQIAKWITTTFLIKATSSYELFLNNEQDEKNFMKAKQLKTLFFITKDRDFVDIQNRLKSPPKIIPVKKANCATKKMKQLLNHHLLIALEELINTSTELVEINQENIF